MKHPIRDYLRAISRESPISRIWSVPPRSVLSGLGFFLLGSLSNFWLLRHSGSVTLIDGTLIGIGAGLLVFLYMTERKLAEESRLRHAAIVESSEDAIISGTMDGIIVTWNGGAQRIYGYTAAEAVGRSISILAPPELPDEENKILETLRTGRRIEHFETVRVTKAGKRINISLTISPLKDSRSRTVGICGIGRDISEQKRAEEELRASEKRLRLAQWAARIGTFDVNIETGEDIWTPETEALYGLPPGGFGRTLTAFHNLIHPDDRERISELTQEMMRTGQPAEAEWRVIWPDGSVHWIASRGQAVKNEYGEPSRMLGVNLDVTERKQAEEMRSDMTRKLVEAQEQERTRIARELHDDVSQRLCLLAIELSTLQNNKELSVEVRDYMYQLQQMTSDISADLRDWSHELHCSALEFLGPMKGMRSWCREFSVRQKLQIDFKGDEVAGLPQQISLCLFRVLQEALHNAAKYSGVKRIEVQLKEISGEIHLIVRDSGKGFDNESAKAKPGLGLTSMRERVRLAGGTILIDSKPLEGTTIHVRVPFRMQHDDQPQVTPG